MCHSQVHRQQDREFVEHLHELRVSHPVPAPEHIAWFEQNCGDLTAVPPGTPVTELAPLNRVGAHRKSSRSACCLRHVYEHPMLCASAVIRCRSQLHEMCPHPRKLDALAAGG